MAFTEQELIAKAMLDNPEKYAAEIEALYSDEKTAYLNPKHTGKFFGKKGNQGYAYWDPETASYVRVKDHDGRWSWNNTQLYRNSDGEEGFDMGWYINQFGDHVRGIKPQAGYHTEFASGGTSGESQVVSNVNYTENPTHVSDPNNNTPVPTSMPNPNYNPGLPSAPHSDDFEPQPNGPVITYNPTPPSSPPPSSPPPSSPPPSSLPPSSPPPSSPPPSSPPPSSPPPAVQPPPPTPPAVTEYVPWTGTGEQVDTSWDWDAFKPKSAGAPAWGGYDEDYGAFERYQPGMQSPWGLESGGNSSNPDFYAQQFVNLLREEQGFSARQKQAEEIRQYALDNPFEAKPTDWSWANSGQGLGTVVQTPYGGGNPGNSENPAGPLSVPGYANPITGYTAPGQDAVPGENPTAPEGTSIYDPTLAAWIIPGETSNYDIAQKYGLTGTWGPGNESGQFKFDAWTAPGAGGGTWAEQYGWGNSTSSQDLIDTLTLGTEPYGPGEVTQGNYDWLSNIYNQMYTVPAGNTGG